MVNATLLVVLAVVAIVVVVAGAYEYEQSDSITVGDARLWKREKRVIAGGGPQNMLYGGTGVLSNACIQRARALAKAGHKVGALDYGDLDDSGAGDCHIYRPMKPGEYKLDPVSTYTAWTPWQ